jgi:nucleoside-diphosphate-sugar epimerase
MKTILVTGGAGYAGSVLVRRLLKEEKRVVCADILRSSGESLLEIWGHSNFTFVKCDITNYSSIDNIIHSNEFFAIVHLAAIVGDPACQMEPELAKKINYDASAHLLQKAMERNIPRFVFASTCSNYGKMKNRLEYVDENSPLVPVSLYAELKVKIEDLILKQIDKRDSFCPTSLRFATIYGISPRMRFDLTVNEFTKEIAKGKELLVFGEQFWRPYCHVSDFAGAILNVLASPPEKVAYNVFNVGDTNENYTKKMIVEELLRQMPEARVRYVQKNEDPRDYRVNFSKIKKELGFKISKRVPDGIKEVIEIIETGIIQDTEDQRYYNIPHKSQSQSIESPVLLGETTRAQ